MDDKTKQELAQRLCFEIRQRVIEGITAGYERAYDDTSNVKRDELIEELAEAVMERLGYVCVEFAEASSLLAKQGEEAMNTLRLALVDREAYLSNLSDVQERCTALVEENRALKAKNS